jgi:hypothetical protein
VFQFNTGENNHSTPKRNALDDPKLREQIEQLQTENRQVHSVDEQAKA